MTLRTNLLDIRPSAKLLQRLQSLQFELRAVDTKGLAFADLLIAHVEAIIAVPNRCKKGFIDGSDFSCLFVDALIQSGVSPSQIKTEVRCKKYVAEIDVLVIGPKQRASAFHLKTSARERWRQAERDCIYFTDRFTNAMEMALGKELADCLVPPVHHYVLMVREYKDTTPDQARQFCKSKRGSYAFLSGFHTIYEKDELNRLVQEFSCQPVLTQ